MRRSRNPGRLLLTAFLLHLVPTAVLCAAPTQTLSGEIVDLACYVAHGAKGPEHQKCARKCAQMGQPVGLLTADGNLYLLVADHLNPAPYNKARGLAGEPVEIQGEVSEKSGMKALSVSEVKKK